MHKRPYCAGHYIFAGIPDSSLGLVSCYKISSSIIGLANSGEIFTCENSREIFHCSQEYAEVHLISKCIEHFKNMLEFSKIGIKSRAENKATLVNKTAKQTHKAKVIIFCQYIHTLYEIALLQVRAHTLGQNT